MRRSRACMCVVALALLAGCASPAPAPKQQVAASDVVVAHSVAAPTSEVYQRVGGRALGFSVEVPEGWVQHAGMYVWRSPAGTPRVAFGYVEHEEKRAGIPPDETKLLPGGAQQIGVRRYRFGWSDGTEYTLTYPAPEPRREVHLLLPPGKGPYRDLYSVAAADPAATALADREWEHLLASLVVVGG